MVQRTGWIILEQFQRYKVRHAANMHSLHANLEEKDHDGQASAKRLAAVDRSAIEYPSPSTINWKLKDRGARYRWDGEIPARRNRARRGHQRANRHRERRRIDWVFFISRLRASGH
jgi:hypothetical protein